MHFLSSGFTQLIANIRRLLHHTLYMRLVVLLICIAFSVVLMQAGSLFLLDYIPNSQSAIQSIYQQKSLWQQRLDLLEIRPMTAKEASAGHDFDTEQVDLNWLQAQPDAQLKHALQQLQLAQQSLRAHGGMNPQQSKQVISQLVLANDTLAQALQRDIEVKQSVVSLLQLVSMLLIMCCIGAIAIAARRLLVNRIDALTAFVPSSFAAGPNANDSDEFAALERITYELSARLEGFKAETEWFNQTSSERLRRMIRSQDFLLNFVESVNKSVLSENTLKKNLYLLQKAMNVNNVALIFTENDAKLTSERILYSHHKPAQLNEELFDELTNTNLARFFTTKADGIKTQCLAVGFSSTSGALGILKVEAEEDYLFDETDIQLVEVTAQLLSMVMGFQGREQEGRRVALLEERASIARELHDSLAQSLSFMKIQISRLHTSLDSDMAPDKLREIVNELREGLDNAYRELRELLATFRVHMDVRGLGFAVRSAIDEFMQRSNLTITLDNRLVNCRLTVNEEFHILHVVREALSNIVRHSGATTVMVALEFQSNGSVMVTIDDDGIGYSAKPEEADHYGQTIMKERAYTLGGDIAVLRRRKGGTRVRLVFTPKLPQ